MKRIIISAFLISVLLVGIAKAEEIDWDKARLLHQKNKRGEALTAEESAYLKKAMEARAGKNRPSRDDDDESMRGDGADEKATVKPVPVSEEDSPVKLLKAKASDGNEIEFAYRSPKADRPLPAIVFVHGGLGIQRPRQLTSNLLQGPTYTRFLSKGYVTVAATFRTYGREPQSRGPILDLIAIVKKVQELREVDEESVVIFGTSGGGSIGLELAGSKEVSFPAVVIGEPATVLFTGVMDSIANRERSMQDYPTMYTDELRKATEAKIDAISCPLLVHHGDRHPLKKINFDLVFPAIEKAGKSLEVKMYPGEDHGFYWGNRTSEKTVNAVVANTIEFIEPLLPTKPAG